MEIFGLEIDWLGHASFKVKFKDTIVYFDPWEVEGEGADYILISHEHFDHCDMPTLKKLIKENTKIIASLQCNQIISELKPKILKPFEMIEFEDLKIEAFPAYNINKFREPGKVFHPKEDLKLGYILEIGGRRVYHAGDTDFIPEMKELKNIDIAFLPVSGTYVMTWQEAVDAANTFKPKVAIPMHYGKIVGSREDAENFARNVEVEAIILSL